MPTRTALILGLLVSSLALAHCAGQTADADFGGSSGDSTPTSGEAGTTSSDSGPDSKPAGEAGPLPPPAKSDGGADAGPDSGGDAGHDSAPNTSAPDAAPAPLATNAVVRSFKGSEHFYTLSSGEAADAGYTIEANPYFYVANQNAPGGGFAALHRCFLNSGMHFYTTAANCEGAPGVQETNLGLVAPDARCGAVPLYRLVSGSSGDHFYAVSLAESQIAQNTYGYTLEGIAGYVWTTSPIHCP